MLSMVADSSQTQHPGSRAERQAVALTLSDGEEEGEVFVSPCERWWSRGLESS